MGKVVLARLEKVDHKETVENVKVVDSVGQEEITYILADTAENFDKVSNDGNQIYIPSTLLTVDDQDTKGLHVYFDLENYSFYQKAKEMIEKETKPKGVFRFRRMVKQGESDSLLAGDLYVLSSLLGDPQDVQVKRTDQSVTPAHTIIMMNFGGGTMAHIEYTVTDRERIELEWSGIKNIIEFDSEEVEIVQSGNKTIPTLVYSVDAILATAYQVDQTLIDRLSHFSGLIAGGVNK